jgi:hypothetical protein
MQYLGSMVLRRKVLVFANKTLNSEGMQVYTNNDVRFSGKIKTLNALTTWSRESCNMKKGLSMPRTLGKTRKVIDKRKIGHHRPSGRPCVHSKTFMKVICDMLHTLFEGFECMLTETAPEGLGISSRRVHRSRPTFGWVETIAGTLFCVFEMRVTYMLYKSIFTSESTCGHAVARTVVARLFVHGVVLSMALSQALVDLVLLEMANVIDYSLTKHARCANQTTIVKQTHPLHFVETVYPFLVSLPLELLVKRPNAYGARVDIAGRLQLGVVEQLCVIARWESPLVQPFSLASMFCGSGGGEIVQGATCGLRRNHGV